MNNWRIVPRTTLSSNRAWRVAFDAMLNLFLALDSTEGNGIEVVEEAKPSTDGWLGNDDHYGVEKRPI